MACQIRGVVWVALVYVCFGVSLTQAEPSFSIAVLPDTQYYTWGDTNNLTPFWSQIEWIVSNQASYNIQLVIHVGDITESNAPPEWEAASNVLSRLDSAGIPFVLAIGNHDLGTNGEATTRYTLFNEYFPWDQAVSKPWWGGAYQTGCLENAYYLFNLGGLDWLVLVLEFGPRDEVLEWANQVVATHPNHRVILLTHAHVAHDNTLLGSSPSHPLQPWQYGLAQLNYANGGVDIWEKLIRKHSHIAFALCGHALSSNGAARCVMTTDYGTVVYQLMSNYQHFDGGLGFLRVMTFTPSAQSVAVSTYSPFLKASRVDPDNTFTLRHVRALDTTPALAPSVSAFRSLPNCGACLRWSPSEDEESGIASYEVYLNGERRAIVWSNEVFLNRLSENATYTARVVAVNGGGMKSPASQGFEFTVPADRHPPGISSIVAKGNKIRVVFSEPVDLTTLTNLENFSLSGGASVTAAYWNAWNQSLTLETTPLNSEQVYILTISNVSDVAMLRNRATTLRRRFTSAPHLLWEDFERGNMEGWIVVDEGTMCAPSSWTVSNGVLRQASNIFGPDAKSVTNRKGTYAYWSSPGAWVWSQYIFRVKIRTQDDDGIGIIFHFQNPSNYCKLDIDAQRNMRKIFELVNGIETTVAQTNGGYRINHEMILVVEVDGRAVSAELDGESLWNHPVTGAVHSAGTIGLYCWGSAGVEFSEIEVCPFSSPSVPEQDSDDDGMPDEWELSLISNYPYDFATIDDIRPHDDADEDGLTTFEEWLAGTDPMDPRSTLRCDLELRDDGSLYLTWPAKPGRVYDVLSCNRLENGFRNWLATLTNDLLSLPTDEHTCFFSLQVRLASGP